MNNRLISLQPGIFIQKGEPYNILIDLFYENVIRLNDEETNSILECISNNKNINVNENVFQILFQHGIISDIKMPNLHLEYSSFYTFERVFLFFENKSFIDQICFLLKNINIGYVHIFLDSLEDKDIETLIDNINSLDLQCLDISIKTLNCIEESLEKFYLKCRPLANIFYIKNDTPNVINKKFVVKLNKINRPSLKPFNINFKKAIHINQFKWLKSNNYNLGLYRTIFIKDNKVFETPFESSLGEDNIGIEKFLNLYEENLAQGLIKNDQILKCNICTLRYICESFSPLKKVNNYQYEKHVSCNFKI